MQSQRVCFGRSCITFELFATRPICGEVESDQHVQTADPDFNLRDALDGLGQGRHPLKYCSQTFKVKMSSAIARPARSTAGSKLKPGVTP